jgi:hypothetical protein
MVWTRSPKTMPGVSIAPIQCLTMRAKEGLNKELPLKLPQMPRCVFMPKYY